MPSLIPARFRTSRTAAVDIVDGSGIGPIPQSVVYTRDQQRAAMYAERIGFVRRAYEFVAWQAARCTLRPEADLAGAREWEPSDDDLVWAALDTFTGERLSQADLVRAAVFKDDTVGECFLVIERHPDRAPTWSVRSPAAMVRKAGTVNGRKTDGYMVLDAPGGKPDKGTARWVPASDVYRHWQPSTEYDLIATSSLMGLLDDLDTYWTLARTIRRTARSRLATGDILWTPSEAHTKRRPENTDVSEFEYQYAQAAAASLNDADDTNVASVAPFMVNTPGTLPPPQIIAMPGVTAEQLAHLQDARMVVADALPLSTSALLTEAQGNHWNEWLAAEGDVELIEDRLARVARSITDAVLRPTLQRLVDAGLWSGDPDRYRVGFDTDPIRRRPDNSANALQAADRAAIGWAALRRELHFGEDDAPTEDEVRQLLTIRALGAGRPSPFGQADQAPVAVTQAPPASPVPELPAGPGEQERVASLPIIDDRWLLADR